MPGMTSTTTRAPGRHPPPGPRPPAMSRQAPGPAAPPRAAAESGEVMGIAVVIVAIVALTGLGVMALLVLVLVSIRDEDRHMSLTGTPRTRTEAVTRRLLGVGVRTPGPCPGNDRLPPGSDLP